MASTLQRGPGFRRGGCPGALEVVADVVALQEGVALGRQRTQIGARSRLQLARRGFGACQTRGQALVLAVGDLVTAYDQGRSCQVTTAPGSGGQVCATATSNPAPMGSALPGKWIGTAGTGGAAPHRRQPVC